MIVNMYTNHPGGEMLQFYASSPVISVSCHIVPWDSQILGNKNGGKVSKDLLGPGRDEDPAISFRQSHQERRCWLEGP